LYLDVVEERCEGGIEIENQCIKVCQTKSLKLNSANWKLQLNLASAIGPL
jgi:dissimilatory sulfite reductase (desulfoviridin) alpha/beta subunit